MKEEKEKAAPQSEKQESSSSQKEKTLPPQSLLQLEKKKGKMSEVWESSMYFLKEFLSSRYNVFLIIGVLSGVGVAIDMATSDIKRMLMDLLFLVLVIHVSILSKKKDALMTGTDYTIDPKG